MYRNPQTEIPINFDVENAMVNTTYNAAINTCTPNKNVATNMAIECIDKPNCIAMSLNDTKPLYCMYGSTGLPVPENGTVLILRKGVNFPNQQTRTVINIKQDKNLSGEVSFSGFSAALLFILFLIIVIVIGVMMLDKNLKSNSVPAEVKK